MVVLSITFPLAMIQIFELYFDVTSPIKITKKLKAFATCPSCNHTIEIELEECDEANQNKAN